MAEQAAVRSRLIRFTLNGEPHAASVRPEQTLVSLLRDTCNLTGTKRGCDYGGCGCCTVVMDGDAIYSCMMPAWRAGGAEITTIEGLDEDGEIHPIQKAFVEKFAFQCGYCTPGFIMSAAALLERNRNPSREEIKQGILGNLCRCTGYNKIVEAIEAAAAELRSK